jgi:pimeloyl-ACP methyl ester carboxylesterase
VQKLFRLAILLASALTLCAHAQVSPYPSGFRSQRMEVAGATLHVRVGGTGPAVVLIHGFGDTGDMWAPLAAALAKNHTVVVPDLRGMGLSSRPEGGYDKKTQAADVRGVLDKLGIDKSDIVGHDIGTMVAYAYAARYPEKTTRLVVMDAPVPGIPPWNDIVRSPALWHFSFGGPDALRLVKGRERIYLDRFWNEFAGTPSKIDEGTRKHYAKLYALPGDPQGCRRQPPVDKDEAGHAGAGYRRHPVVRGHPGGRHAQRRAECHGAGCAGFWALADGGATCRHGAGHPGFSGPAPSLTPQPRKEPGDAHIRNTKASRAVPRSRGECRPDRRPA